MVIKWMLCVSGVWIQCRWDGVFGVFDVWRGVWTVVDQGSSKRVYVGYVVGESVEREHETIRVFRSPLSLEENQQIATSHYYQSLQPFSLRTLYTAIPLSLKNQNYRPNSPKVQNHG